MDEERITVTVKFDGKIVTLEGPAAFVRAEVQRFAGGVSGLGSNGETSAPGSITQRAVQFIERELISAKQPQGYHETIAVLAFSLREQGKIEFTPEEMRQAYLRAGVRPPKVVAQALRDARRHYDYITAGKERGTYRLSEHGERVVLFDLPRSK